MLHPQPCQTLSLSNKGFSLVELSIVLVIIGLLVGGTLVGQDLIRAAEMSATIRDLENYQAAVNTFKLKFGGLPGDIDNADNVFLASEWPLIANGDANGLIRDGSGASAEFTGEIAQFWMQLAASKLIEGNYTTAARVGEGIPNNPLERGGMIAYYDVAEIDKNVFYIGVTDSPNPGTDDTLTGFDSLLPGEAFAIDEKMDDGHPQYGAVRARGSVASIGDAVYYYDLGSLDPEHFLHVSPLASVLGNLIISSAYAGSTAVSAPDACIYIHSSDPDPDATAAYAIASGDLNCQLSIDIRD